MSDHPCVVTISHQSKPRVLFSGDKLIEVDLPVGTRVIYPKPPMEPLNDVKAAILICNQSSRKTQSLSMPITTRNEGNDRYR